MSVMMVIWWFFFLKACDGQAQQETREQQYTLAMCFHKDVSPQGSQQAWRNSSNGRFLPWSLRLQIKCLGFTCLGVVIWGVPGHCPLKEMWVQSRLLFWAHQLLYPMACLVRAVQYKLITLKIDWGCCNTFSTPTFQTSKSDRLWQHSYHKQKAHKGEFCPGHKGLGCEGCSSGYR